MLMQKKSTKIIAALLVTAMIVITMSSVWADQPFTSFGYDWWDDTYPTQDAYTTAKVITAADIIVAPGHSPVSPLRFPEDLFVYENNNPDGLLMVLDPSSPLWRTNLPFDDRPETFPININGVYTAGPRVFGPILLLADTGNDRIIIMNEDFELIRILHTFHYRNDFRIQNFIGETDDYGNPTPEAYAAYWAEVNRMFEIDQNEQFVRGRTTAMNAPTGVHVTNFNGETRLYIADSNGGRTDGNQRDGRILAADINGGVWMEYHRPDSDTFINEEGDPASFNPTKVLTDNAANVYVLVPGISRGAVTFSEDGVFGGFFGANRVSRTGEAIMNYFLRFILPRDVMNRRTRPTPVNISNFTLDRDQFLYTVTMDPPTGVEVVSKINPAGDNIFAGTAFDDVTWGAATNPIVMGREHTSEMIAIAVDHRGDIFLLCHATGQIFQYDKEGHLLFIFGGRGNQQGTFRSPVAIETYQNTVYVLDRLKESITVFELTEFGALVAEAMDYFEAGDYLASREPWEEVIRRDANFFMASVGMGNALLSAGDFEGALNFFYRRSDTGYERAFREFRTIYIRDNFNTFLIIALSGIALLITVNVVLKVRKKKRG
jgi:hypothetical protein